MGSEARSHKSESHARGPARTGFRWAVSVLAAGLLSVSGASGGTCHAVDGDRILGRDLVAAVPALQGLDPDAEVSFAPVPGVQRVFHPEEVSRVAREHGLQPPERPVEPCFERKTQPLTAEMLAPVIAQALAIGGAHVEILDFSRVPVPHGTLEFSRGALTAAGVWHGQMVYGEGRSMPLWVRLRVTDEESGAPVPLRPEATPREVTRGDTVRVEVWSGPVVVAFDATSESSGRKGEMVLVQNPDKTRRLLARVEDKGKVVVKK